MKKLISKVATLSALTALTLGATSLAPQSASADTFACAADSVMEYPGNRIHVRCTNSITLNGNVVRYIAISASSASAARFVAAGNAAVLSGKKFRADIPASSATNVAGCLVADCRTPTAFGLMP